MGIGVAVATVGRAVAEVVQLGSRIGGEGLVLPVGRIAGEHLGQYAGAFVDPGVVTLVLIPVDHMLELVSNGGVEVGRAQRKRRDVHVQHLALVAEGVDRARVEVLGGIVAADAG